ncbi:MAG: HAMP domain-containing protein, partial [Anaerolineae bacterium]|nr:HAMP domain-containing protein [Anaerolineae bacterium]
MTTNKIPKLKTLKGQARNAFWLSVFTAVGASLFGAYNFYFATSSGIWQLYGVALLMAGFATATSIGAWFAFHENAQQSGWVMLLSFLFSVAGMSFLIAGMGRIMIVPIIILGISGTVLMLSAKTQQQAILITILGGIAGLLVDFFVPRFQIEFQSDIDIMTIIIGTISAVFALVLVRQFSSYPFRTKLVLAFIFLSSLVIGAAFTLINLTMRQVLETNANEKLLANASASANNVDTFLSYTLDSVSTASAYLDLRSYLLLAPEKRQNTQTERQVQNLLFSSKNSNPDILSYGLLDINGINVIDSDTANIGRNESTEDYFQLSLNANEKYISPVLYLPDEKEAVLFFSVPVHNEMGIITGVLRVKYRASALQDVLINERNIVGEGSYSALFDSNHIFLAHSQNPNLIGKIAYPPSSEDINNLRENLLVPSLIPDEDIFHDNKELEERLSDFASTPYFSSENLRSESATSGAVTQLETVPWLITTAQPSVIFLAPIQEQTRRIFIAALVLIAFAIFSGIALSNILIAPILRLKNTAQKFVEGDLNAVASVDTDDEIGSLALTFNNLVSRLRGIVETLENRVEERTKDLETRTGYLEGAAEVSRAVGSMLDTNMLIVQIVDLIKERFGLYYVGLFLTDNKNEWAVLKAGTGEAGQRMLQREHRLRIGEGMIGWSIENEEARIALDVGED